MDLTRRRLIGRAVAGGGALLGGALLAPRVVFAGGNGEAVFELRVPAGGGVVETRRTFELIGIRGAAGDVEVRARGLDGRWSEWLPVHAGRDHGPDGAHGSGAARGSREIAAGGSGAAGGSRAGAAGGSRAGAVGGSRAGAARGPLSDPVWTGPARAFELRSTRSLRGARAVLVDGGRGATASAAQRFVDAGLPAAAGQPTIIARSSWATASCRPRVPAIFGQLDLAFVHHTVSSNAYRPSQSAGMVRSICLFHKYGNGWNDIGYNFVVDRHGQVFEARAGGIDETIVGAQAGGYNVYSTGVALLGNFSHGGPPRKAFDALTQLLAWKLALHGVEVPGHVTVEVTRTGAPYSRYRGGARVRLDRVSGHRDADATECSGAGMYRQLPRLRQRVSRLLGSVGSLGLQVQAVAPGSVMVGGVLSSDGLPIAAATVEVQRRSSTRGPTVLGQATSDQNGTWSATVPLATNAELRAVYRGDAIHSAVVSPGTTALVPPRIDLSTSLPAGVPGAVIAFTGSIDPAKPRVTIAIAQQQLDGTYLTVRTIPFRPAADGTFARSIGFAEPGRYEVVAHTSADDLNALGTSPPVAVTIA